MPSSRKLTKSILNRRNAINKGFNYTAFAASSALPLCFTQNRRIMAAISVPLLCASAYTSGRIKQCMNGMQRRYNNRTALMRGDNPRKKRSPKNTRRLSSVRYLPLLRGERVGGKYAKRQSIRGNPRRSSRN